jgi:hypothetical protein
MATVVETTVFLDSVTVECAGCVTGERELAGKGERLLSSEERTIVSGGS